MRGGQYQVLLLLKTMRSAGHSFVLLARAGSPLFERAKELRFNVQSASLLSLRRLSGEFDVVHAHDAKAHSWAALASRRPFVVSRRVAFPVGAGTLSRVKYQRAARFLAVSEFVSGRLQAAGVAQSKIDLVPDSVEPASMQNWSPDAPVVALASADKDKGRDLVERAATLARIAVSYSNDIEKDFGYASVFVYSSRSEGFGSAALVAMSRGVPVIASRIDGMAEVLEDGVSGIFVENDPAEIAAAIQRVRSGGDLTRSMIVKARARVESLFSPSNMLLKTLASYRRALGS
jgi:glycosyltransferase involved in cell wall biosynthesis